MSDQGTDIEFSEQLEQAGQSVSADALETEQPQAEPQFVSREEFQQAMEDILRRAQGLVDKSASRLDKRVAETNEKVNGYLELARESGMNFTPEQENLLRRNALDKAMLTHKQSVQAEPAQQPMPQEQQGLDPISAAAMSYQQKAGIFINENDPEVRLVNTTTEDPLEYLQSVKDAITKKQARLAKPKGNPAAAPGVAATGSPANLLAEYEKKKSTIHGDVDALFALKDEYRKKGLKI